MILFPTSLIPILTPKLMLFSKILKFELANVLGGNIVSLNASVPLTDPNI